MAKSPQNPKEIFPDIIDDYRGLFGDDLISIILYGSATGSDYRPGKSDINFMVVLSENGIEQLEQAIKAVTKWRDQMAKKECCHSPFSHRTLRGNLPRCLSH
jgi:hypothetical protein